jgi:cytochrome P450
MPATMDIAPATSIKDLPELDVTSTEYTRDPYEVLRRAQQESWIFRSSRGVEIVRYEPHREMLRDRRLSLDLPLIATMSGISHPDVWRFRTENMINTVGALHSKLRSSVARFFAPQHAEELRPVIRSIISSRFDTIEASRSETIDLLDAVCNWVPALTYAHMVGAPREDAPFIIRVSSDILEIFKRDPAVRDTVESAYLELFDYTERRFEQCADDLHDDLLSNLILAERSGSLTHREAADLSILLLEASTENTTHEMALVMSVLLEHPTVWQEIVSDQSLIAQAVEEAMRIRPRAISNDRSALQDLTWRGLEIPKGTRCILSTLAATRDPEAYPRPEVFDIHRVSPRPNVMFGGGVTACLGQNVAKVEIQEFVAELATRYPEVTAAGPATWELDLAATASLGLNVQLGPRT